MAEVPPKIKVLHGASPDLSAATYQIYDESHTIGNSLRWMLMKNPKVEFCGYSNPHPSENVINVRIQMYDNLSSLDALIKALDDLDNLCNTVEDAYLESLREEKFERWDEKR
ncbi:hypothetical protein EST38_g4328 [Candolleomyces aberdarensis]|uniref:DNA-directed RNA polymerases I and III subunit RPAC2 n=1 Tax=Candolleomyces aberdarensis TaxID=2316362 RepID=A0A4Q2DN77_9AGAR|nr:hypothetical protein EST38_g4328 [Candolleomyces aberdarensis]